MPIYLGLTKLVGAGTMRGNMRDFVDVHFVREELWHVIGDGFVDMDKHFASILSKRWCLGYLRVKF